MSLVVPDDYSPASWELHFHDGKTPKAKTFKLENVYDDDDVDMIMKKIAKQLKVTDPYSIWLWYEVQVGDPRVFWRWVVDTIYKYSEFCTAEEVVENYFKLTNHRLDKGTLLAELSKDDCVEVFVKANHPVFLPLGIEWQSDGMNVFGNACSNPPQVPPNSITILQYLHTLSSFNIAKRRLYARVIDTSDLLPQYKGRTSLMTGELPDPLTKVSIPTCSVRYVQLRTKPSSTGADIDTLFQNFKAFEVAPFVKKINRLTGTMIKMHKFIDVSPTIIETWAKSEVFRKARTFDSLVIWFKSPGDDDVQYSPLTILSDGSVDLKVKLKNVVSLDVVREFVENINVHIRELSSKLPTLDTNVLTVNPVGFSQTSIINIVANVGFETQMKSDFTNLQAALKAKEFQHWIAGSREANILLMQYKRVTDFSSLDNINSYIAKHLTTGTTGLLIEKLQSMFGLTGGEAVEILESWNQKYKLEDLKAYGFLARKLFQAADTISLRVTITGTGYNVNMEGMTSFGHILRIQYLLRILFANSHKYKSVDPTPKAPVKISNKLAKDLKNAKEALKKLIDDSDDEDDDLENFMKDRLEGDGDDGMGEEDEEKNDNTEAKPPKNVQNPTDSTGVDALNLLKELKAKDRDLFMHRDRNKKTQQYSRVCQKASDRQPVVMTKAELERSKDAFAATNYINYGSTESLQKQNYYACPDVWCPKSRKALSRSQYEKLISEKKTPCDDPYETPALFYKKPAWVEQERFVGFVKPDKHPKQLCMPCCFTKSSLGSKDSDGLQCTTNQQGNPKYIVGTNKIAEPGRYGTIPNSLSRLVGNNSNKGGMLELNARQYLRQGIPLSVQSFLTAIVEVVGNPNIKTETDLITTIKNNLTVDTFIKLDNGLLCKRFMKLVDSKTIYEQSFWNRFKTWYQKQKVFTGIPPAMLSERVFSKPNLRSPTSISDAKSILRLYMLWAAYDEFLEHLQDASRVKTHEMLLSLVNLHLDWLNVFGYNVMIVEAVNDDIYIPKLMSPLRRKQRFVVLVKTDTYYEPLVLLINTPKTETEIYFSKGPVVDLFASAAPTQNSIFIAPELQSLRDRGTIISEYIIDYDLQFCGVRLASGEIVNFEKSMSLDSYLEEKPIQFLDGVEIDLDMFIGWKEIDDRSTYISRLQLEKAFLDALWNEAVAYIEQNSEIQKRLGYLRHAANPLVTSFKHVLIDRLLGDDFYKDLHEALQTSLPTTLEDFHNTPCSSINAKEDCTGQCQWIVPGSGREQCKLRIPKSLKKNFISHLVSELASPFVPLLYRNIVITPNHNVVTFTEDEVRAGKLHEFLDKQSVTNLYGIANIDKPLKRLQKAVTEAEDLEFPWEKGKLIDLPDKKQKILESIPNLAAHPLGTVYSKATFYEFMRIVGSTPESPKTIDGLQNIVSAYVEEMYRHDRKMLMSMLKLNNTCKLPSADPSLQEVRSAMDAETYLPAELEIYILSRSFGDISFILCIRKTTDGNTNNPIEYRYFNKIGSPRCYVLLQKDKTEIRVILNKQTGKHKFVTSELKNALELIRPLSKEYRSHKSR